MTADRYCLVGAGPAGLIAARALLNASIPFDAFERHSDVGGIWDLENAGTPMYDDIPRKWTPTFGYFFPSTVSVADVKMVARMRSNSISLMMCDTSIGAARRNTPRLRVSRK